jgi:uncharacterized membrane protein
MREKNRIIVKFSLTRLDWILEVLAVLILLIQGLYLWIHFIQLPSTIPVHFDLQGAADGYGSKTTLLIMPSISIAIYTTLTILSRFPHTFNYPLTITETNAPIQYQLATRLIRILKLIILILFMIILFHSTEMALYHTSIWNKAFLPTVLILLIMPFVYLLYATGRRMI